MHRAAGAVATQSGKPEALRHHALAGKRRIAVNEQRHHHGAVFRRGAEMILLGAHLAEHHRIDDFQMRRIGGERQMHFVGVELAVRRGAEVIFDVARAFDLVGRRRAALELVEDGAVRLGHDLRQHVEPAAVRHADDDLAHAERAAALDDLLQRRDHRFAAVEAEALGAGEFQVAEFFKAFGFDQLVEDGALAFAGERDLLVRPFDALLDPAFLGAVGDVQKFDAERLAIGAPQDGDDLADGAEFEPEHLVEKDRTVEIGFAEAVGARIELLFVLDRLEPERIEIGVEMAARPIGADQHQRPYRVARRPFDVGGGKLDAAALRLRLDLDADAVADLGPVAVERRDEIAARQRRPIGPAPRRAARVHFNVGSVVLQALEERLPLGIDRLRIDFVAGIEVFDIGGIAAIEERGEGEGGVGVLAGHGAFPGQFLRQESVTRGRETRNCGKTRISPARRRDFSLYPI